MSYSSVIHNFTKITVGEAEELRARLSLSMPTETLVSCGIYYKKHVKRDPSLDELQMLDMLFAARAKEAASLTFTELVTRDFFVAQTYADMIKKHAQNFPEATHPITLGEALNTANTYLCNSKKIKKSKKKAVPHIEYVGNDFASLDASYINSPNFAYRMHPVSFAKPNNTDILILVLPKSDDTPDAFRCKFAKTLRNTEMMKSVKSIAMIGNAGILAQVLKITSGAEIWLSAFSVGNDPIPVSELCNHFLGCHILRVEKKKQNDISLLLRGDGMRAIPFASVTKGSKIVFVRDEKSKFAIDSHFLRALSGYKAVGAKLADESAELPDYKDCAFIKEIERSIAPKREPIQLGEVTAIGSLSCVAASAAPQNAYYKTAVWSVLAPVAALCACGAPYNNQMLSLALEVPKRLSNSETIGKCVSTIFGLYRAQIELGLATAGQISICTNRDLNAPSVSAWTMAENLKQTSNTFVKPGSFVYALPFELDEDGLPYFSALQKKLKSLSKFARKGKTLSARVVWNESILDGIVKMQDSLVCTIQETDMDLDEVIPMAILIESKKRLPLLCIGKTCPREA